METTENKNNELVKIIQTSGLEEKTSEYIKEKFMPFFEQANEWREKALALNVTDENQLAEMEQAREARIFLKNLRVNADKMRKALKEDSLRYGKAVQGIYNVIEALITPTEEHLDKQEKFIEIQAQKRKAELKATREKELAPYSEFVPLGIDLANMDEHGFGTFLNGVKLQLEAKVAAEKKAEEDRIAREKSEAEEKEKQRLEFERLKKENEEKEKQLAEQKAKADAELKAAQEKAAKEKAEMERLQKIESEKQAKILAEQKAKQDAELQKEKDAKAKLEAELKAKADAEAKVKADEIARKKAEELAAKKAAKAPDKEKLTKWVDDIMIGLTPSVGGDAHKLALDIHVKFQGFQNWAKEQINSL